MTFGASTPKVASLPARTVSGEGKDGGGELRVWGIIQEVVSAIALDGDGQDAPIPPRQRRAQRRCCRRRPVDSKKRKCSNVARFLWKTGPCACCHHAEVKFGDALEVSECTFCEMRR